MKAVPKLNYDQPRPYLFVLSPVLANLTDEPRLLLGRFVKDSRRWRTMPYVNAMPPHAVRARRGQPVHRKSLERLRIAATTVSALEPYAAVVLAPLKAASKRAVKSDS